MSIEFPAQYSNCAKQFAFTDEDKDLEEKEVDAPAEERKEEEEEEDEAPDGNEEFLDIHHEEEPATEHEEAKHAEKGEFSCSISHDFL